MQPTAKALGVSALSILEEHVFDQRTCFWSGQNYFTATPCTPVQYCRQCPFRKCVIIYNNLTNSVTREIDASNQNMTKLEIWDNAQRDGRPADYSRRSLFNAPVWLTPTGRVPCSNAAKTRNPLKFAGFPKLTKWSHPLVGRTSPYCKDMWGRYCCLTSFFRLSIHALVAKI